MLVISNYEHQKHITYAQIKRLRRHSYKWCSSIQVFFSKSHMFLAQHLKVIDSDHSTDVGKFNQLALHHSVNTDLRRRAWCWRSGWTLPAASPPRSPGDPWPRPWPGPGRPVTPGCPPPPGDRRTRAAAAGRLALPTGRSQSHPHCQLK